MYGNGRLVRTVVSPVSRLDGTARIDNLSRQPYSKSTIYPCLRTCVRENCPSFVQYSPLLQSCTVLLQPNPLFPLLKTFQTQAATSVGLVWYCILHFADTVHRGDGGPVGGCSIWQEEMIFSGCSTVLLGWGFTSCCAVSHDRFEALGLRCLVV